MKKAVLGLILSGLCYWATIVQANDWVNKPITELRQGAEQGNASAQHVLGVRFFVGSGVPQDYKQAVVWLRKAAEQGDALAQAHLGVMYRHGQGVPQNYNQAAVWLRKAAEQGNANAQLLLASLYQNGQGVHTGLP